MTDPTPPRRPDPTPTPLTQPYWDGARERELLFQRCTDCAATVFPPRGHCTTCWRRSLRWERSTGHGRLASETLVHRPGHPGFADAAPYSVALVDLDEGFRMLSNVEVPAGTRTEVGSPLVVTWREQNDYVLPVFVPEEPS